MSLLGYQRWQAYKETGIWPALQVTSDAGFWGGDFGDAGPTWGDIKLAKSVKENPLARKHIVVWRNHMAVSYP